MKIKLGSKEIELRHFVGHTRGDTVVYLPQDRILIAGDLITLPVPFGGDDYPDKLIESLDELMSIPAGAIVPGHGDVLFSHHEVRLQRELYESLMEQAERAARERLSLEEFKKALDLTRFKQQIVGDDPELNWGWQNYFLEGEIETAYHTARGER